MQNIDTSLDRPAVDADLVARRDGKANATLPAWMQRTGMLLAVAALCSAAAGCAADTGATTSEKSDGSGQMRYYGGPKSPMWSDR